MSSRADRLTTFALVIAVGHGVPLAMLNTGAVASDGRFVVWSVAAVGLAAWSTLMRRGVGELGLVRRVPRAAAASHAIFALVALFIALMLGGDRSSPYYAFGEVLELGTFPKTEGIRWGLFALYPLWVFGQELVFRAVVFAEARAAGIRSDAVPALLSTALYTASFWTVAGGSYVHYAFVAGFVWAALFARYRALWPGVVGHTAIGWFALVMRYP